MNNHCGVYVHIPYCASLCPYCDFNSYVSPQPPWEDFFKALTHAFNAHAPHFAPNSQLQSIYFGGGTPSLAPPHLIQQLITHITHTWGTTAPLKEITLEANPGTVSMQSLEHYRTAGVQRLSLGWQSTHDRLLKTLGRGHSAQDSHEAFKWARQAGFHNISIDLIFAVPGQTMSDLEEDVRTLLTLQPEHISLYALTFHEGTPFYKKRSKGTMQQAAHDDEAAMMEYIEHALTQAGYDHYEVSNYAKPGHQAIHNSLYWNGTPYLGIGPGAHSFYHTQDWEYGLRWETVRDPRTFIQTYASPQPTNLPKPNHTHGVAWAEELNHTSMLQERMLCATRTSCGIPLNDPVLKNTGSHFQHALKQACAQGWLSLTPTHILPTQHGMRHADAVASLFF